MSVAVSVVQEIDEYIRTHGGGYRAWYVGIAANPRDRLFNGHCVRKHGDLWIYRDAGSDAAARQAESYFLSLGCRGGDGGGSFQTRFVYAYKMALQTRP